MKRKLETRGKKITNERKENLKKKKEGNIYFFSFDDNHLTLFEYNPNRMINQRNNNNNNNNHIL